MRLRPKLLAVAACALVIPIGGWNLLRQMDHALRSAREETLLASAELLARSPGLETALPPGDSWYLQRIGTPIAVDGFGDDWSPLKPWRQPFGRTGSLLLASWQGRLYGHVSVVDITRNRPTPGAAAEGYDHLDLELGIGGALCRYRIAAGAPGRVTSAPLAPAAARCPDPLRSAWQENGSGYRVEWQLSDPVGRLGIAVHDGASAAIEPMTARPVLGYSLALSEQLAHALPASSRARLVSSGGWVLADTGSPLPDEAVAGPGRWSSLAYRLLVANPLTGDPGLGGDLPRLEAVEVWQALSGVAAISWRHAERSGVVVAAVVPLPGPGDPRGAVVLGQLQPAMPLLARPELFWLLLVCFALLLVGGAALAVFAMHLGRRMARLAAAAERASASDGRVDDAREQPAEPDDELGDLARSHARLLAATGGYAAYLRSLASKLSHELHTPLAVVTSSLDNLDAAALPDLERTYVTRAREGAARLGALVQAMGAASRVERALAASEPEDFDLKALVAGCADGYRLLAGERRFELALPEGVLPMHGAPDLVAQALDKLFDNALSFTPKTGWMALSLRAVAAGAEIELANQGPSLPEAARGRLFDSLVSLRQPETGASHLGLGLYIARLIALRHRGELDARNLEGGEGVSFVLRLAGMPRRSIAAPAAGN